MANRKSSRQLERLFQPTELADLKEEFAKDLATRAQIARNAIGNVERFLKLGQPPERLDLSKLVVQALHEIANDPVKSYYGPGYERILATVKGYLREFLNGVKSVAGLESAGSALALAYTYEASELYREAWDLYRYIGERLDAKSELAQEGADRVLQKLQAHSSVAPLGDEGS